MIKCAKCGRLFDPSKQAAYCRKDRPTVSHYPTKPVTMPELKAYQANDGAGINATYCRVMPIMLRELGWNDACERFADASVEAGARAGHVWNKEAELKDIRGRALSTIRNVFLRKYDHTHGEIPDWLPGEFHKDWIDILAGGLRPEVSANHHGIFIRRPKNASAPTADAPPISPETPTTVLRLPRFPLIDFADLVPTDDEPYLVEDLLPRHGLTLIWGKMKTLKSTWTLDVFLHVARGKPYRGLRVQQGRVIYCVFEGSYGYTNRVEALRRHYKIASDEPVPFHLMSASINLIKEHKALIAEVKSQLAARGAADMPIAIVLDTLNRSLHGSESKDEDMGAYIKAADELREGFGCMVAIIHHCGHDESRPRGHSSLSGAIDGQIKIERPERGVSMTAEVELMRDGPEGRIIHSIVKQVEVHIGRDGKPKTAPILIPDEAQERVAKLPKKMHTPRQKTFVRALHEMVAKYGEVFQPDPGVVPVNAVDQEKVRARFYELHNDGDAEQDAKQKAYKRALEDAQKVGYVDSRSRGAVTMVWIAPREYDEE